MKHQLALSLMDIDCWQAKTAQSSIKLCLLKSSRSSGLLAVNVDDINSKTRVLLQKILTALNLKTNKEYKLEDRHDFILIFGVDAASDLTDNSLSYESWRAQEHYLVNEQTRVIVCPALNMLLENPAYKKQIWQDLSSYFSL
ncbi:MAG: hypothetical protein HON55_03770 [Legionellales bacterium]|jgi:DNA polymerase III psi subunit|nr:hypothetical protein [Legionellales bacterium]